MPIPSAYELGAPQGAALKQPAPTNGPDSATPVSSPAPVAAQQLSAPAPTAPAKPKPYNPEEGLRAHLQKRFPDMSPDEWNFAKNYYQSKVVQHKMKELGVEHSIALGDYLHEALKTDAAREAVMKHAEKLKLLKKAYDEKTGGGKLEVPGLLHPKDDPALQAAGVTAEANYNAADATRHEAFTKYNELMKSKGLQGLDTEKLDRQTLRMMIHHLKHGGSGTEEEFNHLHELGGHETPE